MIGLGAFCVGAAPFFCAMRVARVGLQVCGRKELVEKTPQAGVRKFSWSLAALEKGACDELFEGDP